MARVADPAVVGARPVAPAAVGVVQDDRGSFGGEDLLGLPDQSELLVDRRVQSILEHGVEVGVGVAAEDAAHSPAGSMEEEEQVVGVGMGVRLEDRDEHLHRRRTVGTRTPGRGDGRRVERLDRDVHADGRQMLGHQLPGADLGRGGRVDQQGERQRSTVGTAAHPSVAHRVTGRVEHRVGAVDVEGMPSDPMGPGRVGMGPGVVAGTAQAALDDADYGLHVEGHAHGLAHGRIPEDRFAGVEHQVQRLHAVAGCHRDLLVLLHPGHQRRREVAGHEVEFTGLEPREGGLRVPDDGHDQRVDQRRAQEVVGVGLQAIGDARVVLDHDEGPGADRKRRGIGAGIVDALPDVLGKDRNVAAGEQLEGRHGILEGDLDGGVVDNGGRLEHRMVIHVMAVASRPPVVREVLEGEGHVVGGERGAVVPPDVLAQGDRPGTEVLGRLGAGGQPGLGFEAALRPEESVVHQHREVVGQRQRLRNDERIQVLLSRVQTHADHDVIVVLRGRRRRRRDTEQ